MEQSLKFKILFECKKIKSLKRYVLPIYMTDVQKDLPQLNSNFILRSALKSENSRLLNSGIGLSLKNIKTQSDYESGLIEINKLKDLDFSILQPQFDHSTHLTIYCTKHFSFIEAQGDCSGFDFIGLTTSSNKVYISEVSIFLKLFKKYYHEEYILEIGFSKDGLFLYQANTLTGKDLDQSFYSSILKESLLINQRLKNNSFFNHMKISFSAARFRSKKDFTHFSDCLNNWLYIFFYFKLFCIQNKLHFSGDSFQAFLNSNSKLTHLSKLLGMHLEIAKKTNEMFNWEVDSVFNDNNEIYLGLGQYTGVVDSTVLISSDLTPNLIKQKKPKLILTTYRSLLGHPALYCAQESIMLVGGIKPNDLARLSLGDKFSIDFNLKQIHIEYLKDL